MTKFDNFLIRFFWPKELRRLVDQYRAEGYLNEEAIKFLLGNLKVSFLVCVVCAGFALAHDAVLGVVVFILCIFGVKYSFYIVEYSRLIRPYLNGEETSAKVFDVLSYAGFIHKRKLICQIDEVKDRVAVGPIYGKLWSEFHSLEKGQTINVFWEKGARVAAPNTALLKQKYFLKQEAV